MANTLEEVQEEKHAGDSLVVSPKDQENIDFKNMIERTDKERVELMKAHPIKEFVDDEIKELNKDGIIANLNVWISLYMNAMQVICVKNPILIRKNQEVVIEFDNIINGMREKLEDVFEYQKSIATTLDFINKLKEEIEHKQYALEEYKETIKFFNRLLQKIA